MTRLILSAALVALALPAAAQEEAAPQQSAALPSEAACNAVRERVQVALGRADRGLGADDAEQVSLWTAVAADYSAVYSAFCAGGAGSSAGGAAAE